MKNLEIEYKVLLNKNDFSKLEDIFSNDRCFYHIQENTYFETDDSLLKNIGLSLRIRYIENENKYIATLKNKVIDGHIEYEFETSSNDVSNMPKEIIDILLEKNIDVRLIKEIARLKTIRKEYQYKNGRVCLDHNFYYGIEDYELEYESDSMEYAKNTINQLLNDNNIDFKENKKSKIHRAIENKK